MESWNETPCGFTVVWLFPLHVLPFSGGWGWPCKNFAEIWLFGSSVERKSHGRADGCCPAQTGGVWGVGCGVCLPINSPGLGNNLFISIYASPCPVLRCLYATALAIRWISTSLGLQIPWSWCRRCHTASMGPWYAADPEQHVGHWHEVILQWKHFSFSFIPGDGQVDFDEFMTILGPKLVSSEGRDGFLGNTIDSIFWQVSGHFLKSNFSQPSVASRIDLLRTSGCEHWCTDYWSMLPCAV